MYPCESSLELKKASRAVWAAGHRARRPATTTAARRATSEQAAGQRSMRRVCELGQLS